MDHLIGIPSRKTASRRPTPGRRRNIESNLRLEAVGALGNVLIGKQNVVVSSKQHARKTLPTLHMYWIALTVET